MTTNPLIDLPSWPLADFRVPREFVKHWESRYKEVGHKPDAVLQLVAEQALEVINSTSPYLDDTAINTIRRALEEL